ncbi:MAG: ATP synthase F1 subunit gamma [Prevotella sp.]|nr:ATP synthase F1 subunit gamma [Staphylococcus sp.]MCM1350344.1 ATP synthase F1 subunit gamma [Prevotella sp.]
MAGQSRKVKTRIVATKKTAQITKAMNMVSASKLKSAEKAIKEYRPFIAKTKDIVVHLASRDTNIQHPLMNKRDVKQICYVVVSSDRGLAGAFNSNVCKELTHQIQSLNGECGYVVYPLGLKAYAYTKKMKYKMLEDKLVNVRDDIEFISIAEVIKTIVKHYLLETFDKVVVIFNHYVNTLVQEVQTSVLLPIEPIASEEDMASTYEFDGEVKAILDTALPIYIENTIYSYVLDSKASEHASRMNSMKNATDNATEVISSLELLYNRARQAAITLELTDIVGGASVVNES